MYVGIYDPKIAFENLSKFWGFTIEEQVSLLGVDENALQDESSFKTSNQLLIIWTLVEIHESLNMLFNCNKDLISKWMKQPNHVFDGKSPLSYILNEQDYVTSIFGRLELIHSELDCEINKKEGNK
jgi:hypothetical protein